MVLAVPEPVYGPGHSQNRKKGESQATVGPIAKPNPDRLAQSETCSGFGQNGFH